MFEPNSKLETTRLRHSTTLAGELGMEDIDPDELYAAMDWLVSKLAHRHLDEGARLLYDVSSSSYL